MLVGLDIGGTKTAVLVVDQELRERSRFETKTDVSSPSNLIRGIISSVNCALDKAEVFPSEILAIGAGLPGRVNPKTGMVNLAVNLNLDSFPFGRLLSTAFNVPVVLENDVRTASLGSFEWLRSQEKINQMAYLSIGTGISAGLVLNGNLYRGASGMAGEIGHVNFEPGGQLCRCGAHGCFETIASGPSIARQWQEARNSHQGQVTTKDVYEAGSMGDPTASAVIRRVSQFMARAIQLLVMLYDVEKVVLGGGVTKSGSSFLDPILSALAQIRSHSDLAREMLPENKVALLPQDSNAPTWGAVKLALLAV